MKTNNLPDLRPYYTLGFPLLGLMALVGVAGIALTIALQFIF